MLTIDHRHPAVTSDLINEREKELPARRERFRRSRVCGHVLKIALWHKAACYLGARVRVDFFTADVRSFDR